MAFTWQLGQGRTHAQGPTNTVYQNLIFNYTGHGTVSHTRSSVSYLQLLLTRADFACCFLDIQICVLVHSKIKPSCTELSITSALKSAKIRMNLRVSSISIFRGPTKIPGPIFL